MPGLARSSRGALREWLRAGVRIMRILVLSWKDTTHPFAGGAEVYTDEVTRAWVGQGHDVTWFCSAVGGQRADEVRSGVAIVRRGSRFSVYREAKRWYARNGRGCFDLVIDEVNTVPFGAGKWVHDAPVVALIFQLCREIWWQEMPLPVAFAGRFFLEKHWLRTYRDRPVLTISQSSKDSFAAYGLNDVTIVPVGISEMVRPNVPKETTPTIVFVGRLARNKRPGDAVAAFALLRHSMRDARLWVIGGGPELETLKAKAPPGVTFHGRVDETTKRDLVARAHVLVVTSVREGWGLVVDEAAAMGTPTIAYDVPGLRDSTLAARGALVVPEPPALARSLLASFRTGSLSLLLARASGAKPWPQVASAIEQSLLHAINPAICE